MGRLNRNGFKYFLCLITGIISGMLIGMISFNALIGYRIDKYHHQIKYLNSVIEDKDIRLEKLEQSINNKFILGSIEVILIYDGDDLDKLTLKNSIKGKYNNLLGKEVKNIDIELAAGVIDNRIMKVDNREYKLKVNKILLSEKLTLWVDVKELD